MKFDVMLTTRLAFYFLDVKISTGFCSFKVRNSRQPSTRGLCRLVTF